MNAIWTIIGQPGRALDAAERTTAEAGMLDPILRLESLDVDTLTWTLREDKSTVYERPIVPDRLQQISLYRNGVCVFRGEITSRRYRHGVRGNSGYSITASGALYKMSIAQIYSERNDVQATGVSRPTYVFETGDLREMINRLLLTSPGITAGNIDAMFAVAQRSFTSGTFLSVLVDLLRPVVDAASWVNYAVAGTPQLNIARRSTMVPLIIEIGKDDVNSIDMDARTELRLTGVNLAYSERTASGQPIFKNQSAGDGSQLVMISGPEAGDFIPPDNNSITNVNTNTTTLINGGIAPVTPVAANNYTLRLSSNYSALMLQKDAVLASIPANLGTLPGGFNGTFTIYDNFFGPTSVGNRPVKAITIPVAGGFYEEATTADPYAFTFPVVVSTQAPSWFWEKLGKRSYRYTYKGAWVATHYSAYQNGTPFSPAFNALWNKTPQANRGYGFASIASNNFDTLYWIALPVSMTAY